MRSEFDRVVLNGYWMWRDNLVNDEAFHEFMNRTKRQENEEREKNQEEIPWKSKPESESESIKKKIDHRKYPNHVRKKKQSTHQKWSEEAFEFIEENIDEMNNQEIIKELKKKFGIETTEKNLSQRLWLHGIKRVKRIRKNNIKKKPKKPEMKPKKEKRSIYVARSDCIFLHILHFKVLCFENPNPTIWHQFPF